MNKPLAQLSAHGVSVWLDDLSRELLAGGELQHLIERRHVVGVTTNPTIFASALAKGDRYTDQLRALADVHATVDDAIFQITTDDVRTACDAFQPVFEASGGVDGRVSIEVDPRLARDTEATITAARTLADAVDRPNVLVKIPATEQGLPAITATIAAGISVNVTLIFSLDRYQAVIDAYLTGLDQARDAGVPLSGIHSVASFFVSRFDTEVDARLDALNTDTARSLKGQAALANARLAYQVHHATLATDRWRDLAAAGATPQRPLWASTGVKNPDYPDTRYVEGLVAEGTVNTMPGATLEAFADHGHVHGDTITGTYDHATQQLAALAEVGIYYDDVVTELENQGIQKFTTSWNELADTVRHELAKAG
ncbi:transaldolase [Pseudofrankia inefficax]|uniref:Transaldolase n=1 Tax=Pseudofrankia inefficax (strain DSM 45817 / CECT 9037 / DDB 130130 / EuI1c) TaxID=298654 RepID=E3J8C1_PSEI1|nr:transaldolase [Pseudofrankia inefficax]ADP84455.1 transaldolase [Pseudofrankia inefficax]